MTAVRLVESTKYGARLFAYLFVSVAVGAALVGVGWVLARPELQTALSGQPTADVAAGTILAVLGVYVTGSGLLATINKFIADSVSQGVDAADLDLDVEVKTNTEPTESDRSATGATGRSGDTTATEGASGETADFPPGHAESSGTKASSGVSEENDEIDSAVADELTDETRTDAGSEPPERRTTEVVKPSSETDEPSSLEADQSDFPREPSPEEIAFGAERTDSENERSSSDPLAEQTDDE